MIDNIFGSIITSSTTFKIVYSSLLFIRTLNINILLAKHLSFRTITDGMEVVYLDMSKNETTCMEMERTKETYIHFSVMVVGIIVGHILTMTFVDGVGRKFVLGKFPSISSFIIFLPNLTTYLQLQIYFSNIENPNSKIVS